MRYFVYSVLLLCAALILFQCKGKRPERTSHDFSSSEDFKKLSREKQIEKCGSCHKEIYENEKFGPHANAYKNIKAHIDFVESDAYDNKTYKEILSEGKEQCIGCHASQNMYESIFTPGNEDYELKTTFWGKKKKPRVRNLSTLSTGIDCITCHFDGEAVVTGKNFKPSNNTDCPGYCNPVPSPFFSSNANCAPCHMAQFKGIRDYNETNKTSLTCAPCHSAKSMSGKFSHYTYWSHNPTDKPLPEYLNLFTGIRGEYLQAENTVKVVWKNYLMPHEPSHATELAAIIHVLKDSIIIASDTIRFNRKQSHIENLSKRINMDDFPGVDGLKFEYLGDSIIRKIILPSDNAATSKLVLSVIGIKKEQYWMNDSMHTKYFQKVFPLN